MKRRGKKTTFLLTENFARGSNKIICFGIFIYDSNQELTFDIELSLPPENKVEPSLTSYCKCYGTSKQSAEASYTFSLYSCLLYLVADHRIKFFFFFKEIFGLFLFCLYISYLH